MKPNVLHIANYSPSYDGNFIQSLRILEEKLLLFNQSTVYLFPAAANQYQWVSTIQNRGRSVYFYQNSLLKKTILIHNIIKHEKVGILHLHFESVNTYCCIRIVKVLHPSIRIVVHHHNHFCGSPMRLKLYIKSFLFRADLHIGVSESVTEGFPSGLKKNRITIRNAIYFPRLDVYETLTRQDLDVPEDSRLLLIFGGHFLRKGVDIAIQALAPIAQEENVCLIIVFSVNIEEGALLIKNQTGSVPQWVRLMNARPDIASLYRAVDIFLTPSREEGFCYAAVEAAYCNNLVVASNIAGQNSLKLPYTKEFDIGDTEQFRKHILNCLHMKPDELHTIQKEQKYYVQANFSIDKWATEVIIAYNNL